jgi:hypothetical protein
MSLKYYCNKTITAYIRPMFSNYAEDREYKLIATTDYGNTMFLKQTPIKYEDSMFPYYLIANKVEGQKKVYQEDIIYENKSMNEYMREKRFQ